MDRNTSELMLIKYYKNELTLSEVTEIETWIESCDANRDLAERLYCLYFATEALDAKQTIDVQAALKRVNSRILGNKLRRVVLRLERVAAIMLLPLLGLSIYLAVQNARMGDNIVEIRSTTGMISEFVLPDSTRVWLNSNSSLRYPTTFSGKERRVALSGEGYFEVKKDSKHKFIVDVQSTHIEVYGTEFNIESYDDYVRATLVDGSIGMKYVDTHNRQQTIKMKPNQQVIYSTKTGIIYLNAPDIVSNTSWRDGKIVLRNTSLDETLRLLGNKYNVKFEIRDDMLRKNTFTGTFYNQSLDVILRYFTISSNIQFKQLEDKASCNVADVKRTVYEVY